MQTHTQDTLESVFSLSFMWHTKSFLGQGLPSYCGRGDGGSFLIFKLSTDCVLDNKFCYMHCQFNPVSTIMRSFLG